MTDIAAIILRDTSGRYFVHQRASDKQLYPNLYALGAGGRIELGETPNEAASRELREETGIEGEPSSLFFFDFADTRVSHRVYVFETISDHPLVCAHSEWQWSGWLSESEVDQLASSQKLCPDTLLFYKKYRTMQQAGDNPADQKIYSRVE